jgi:hypothetical protein
MTDKQICFNDALRHAARIITAAWIPEGLQLLLIRDIYGRLRIAIDDEKEKYKELADRLGAVLKELGPYAGDKETDALLFRDDFFNPDNIFQSPDILEIMLPDVNVPIRLLDRQIVGQDWLRTETVQTDVAPQNKPPRLVFYGVKGGIGRSSALAMLAFEMARSGKRVLLMDFDLESPGLSGLLLPKDRLADFGIVDWFIEDGVGQGDLVLSQMISVSPISEHTQGEIRVAAAMGIDEKYYLAKLSRVYADVVQQGQQEHFSHRVRRLMELLEAQEKPDIVLIDSRAGLHDLAAVSIVGLSTYSFLFAVDTAQTWQGYSLLFSHWQAHPTVLRKIRDRLVIVEALFPESDQSARAAIFIEHSYTLFSETIYEKIEPGREPDQSIYNFDINDESAPHYPLRIKWNNRFQEFEPLMLPKGILNDADIAATFGEFLDGAKRLVEGETT